MIEKCLLLAVSYQVVSGYLLIFEIRTVNRNRWSSDLHCMLYAVCVLELLTSLYFSMNSTERKCSGKSGSVINVKVTEWYVKYEIAL